MATMAVSPPAITAAQRAVYDEDRRPELYATLIALVIINNLVAGGRLLAHWRAHYRHHRDFRRVFAEDYFIFLSALAINAVIGNLLAATHYGLGLHSWRINAEDPDFPSNLSHTFKHVWATMLLTGPTFTFIKLALLFFYRRLFLVNQIWLKYAWWANVVYVILWLIGATGYYLFQCWPPQWYFMQYYHRYNRPPPYPISGQCNATTVTNVSIPLIFGLISDVMILVLPVVTIHRLQMTNKAKIGLSLVFSVGLTACLLDLVRIVELNVDTDDKIDPSYGVVIFLILSAATEVAAIVCASMPVIGPQAIKQYKRHIHPSYGHSSGHSSSGLRAQLGRGFEPLDGSRDADLKGNDTVALHHLEARTNQYKLSRSKSVGDGRIWVQSEVKVTVDDDPSVLKPVPSGKAMDTHRLK